MSRDRTAMTDSCAPKKMRSPTLPAVASIIALFAFASPPTSIDSESTISTPGGRMRHTMAFVPRAPAMISAPSA